MKKYDVVSICNALVDMLIQVDESVITELKLTKGVMHLVDSARQREVLGRFGNHGSTTELGGSSLNAIRTLSQLGAKTSFYGAVGDDEYGQLIKSRMGDLGIHCHLSVVTESTGTCLILITPDGERTMNTNLGASRYLKPKEVPTEMIKHAQVFHFCGYQWDTDEQIEVIENAIETAKSTDTKISFDVADPFVIQRHKGVFLNLIRNRADIVFSNKEEARMLFDCGPDEAARKIAESGAIAVIKKGAQGAVIARGRDLIQVAPVSTQVIDTTAAGDMFAAGFLYGFTHNKPLADCGHAAATIASDVISRIGATVSKEAIQRTKLI